MTHETESPEQPEKFNMDDIIVTGLHGTRFKEMSLGQLSDQSANKVSLYASLAHAIDFVSSEQPGARPGLVIVLPSSVESWVDRMPQPKPGGP